MCQEKTGELGHGAGSPQIPILAKASSESPTIPCIPIAIWVWRPRPWLSPEEIFPYDCRGGPEYRKTTTSDGIPA